MAKLVKIIRQQLKKDRKGRNKKSRNEKKGKTHPVLPPGRPVMKSPSEPTIYTPALAKNKIPRDMNKHVVNSQDQINEFISNMRLVTGQPNTSRESHRQGSNQEGSEVEMEDGNSGREQNKTGREIADDLILSAERHKASLIPNPGNGDEILDRVDPNNMNHLVDDGNFLHMTSHVDSVTRAKIQRGEYIELEKLLIKPKHLRKGGDNDNRLEIVNKDGKPYLAQKEDAVKITHVRRWEQAFRIYATVYSQANPNRSAEIFQYINIINQAARSYTWECVEYYDFSFRHMMARKPNRNWAKNFPELWTLSMTEPLAKVSTQSRKRDWRDNCCWKFNKGYCRAGSACPFEHKCTYCGGTSHPRSRCFKKRGNNSGSSHNDRDREERTDRRLGRSDDKRDRKDKKRRDEDRE